MPKLIDLQGQERAGFSVGDPAPTVKRVRFWNVACILCGTPQVRPHAGLTSGDVKPCDHCFPGESSPGPNPHRAPGTIHVQGEPRQVVQMGQPGIGAGECKHGLILRSCLVCKPDGMLHGDALNLVGGIVKGSDTAVHDPNEPRVLIQGNRPADPGAGWEIHESTPEELVQVPAVGDLCSGSGVTRVYGKAEALAEAQEHLEIVRQGIYEPARPGTGRVGMAGLGGCERKMGYKLAYGRPASVAWRPWVGTQAHGQGGITGLDGIYQRANQAGLEETVPGIPVPPRWVTGTHVQVREARGIIDLYDRDKAELIDFKVPGITAVRRIYKGDVSGVYDTQLDLYALGMEALGYPVRSVALFVLPAAGELEDAAWYSRRPDLDNAVRALDRRDKVNAMFEAAGPDGRERVLGLLAIEADSCDHCPVLKAGLCPGVDTKPQAPAAIGWDPTPVATPPGINLEVTQ